MSISTPFIRRPIATSLFIAAMVLVGLAAYPFLPVAPLPRVDFPTILVNARLPGAAPETMASTVAQPLERQFAAIAGIAQMTSVSVQGQTQVTIQFELDRDIDAAAGDVQRAINAASGQLPRNLPNAPNFWKVNPSESPIMILAAQSDALRFALDDREATLALAREVTGTDAEDVNPSYIYDEVMRLNAITPDLAIPEARLVWMRDLLTRTGSMRRELDVAAMIDNSVRTRAMTLVDAAP